MAVALLVEPLGLEDDSLTYDPEEDTSMMSDDSHDISRPLESENIMDSILSVLFSHCELLATSQVIDYIIQDSGFSEDSNFINDLKQQLDPEQQDALVDSATLKSFLPGWFDLIKQSHYG